AHHGVPSFPTRRSSDLIHGRGDIVDTSGAFVNNGTVNADAATGDSLLIYLSNSSSNQNNNLMEATNGGLLSFQGGILDQTGGGRPEDHTTDLKSLADVA